MNQNDNLISDAVQMAMRAAADNHTGEHLEIRFASPDQIETKVQMSLGGFIIGAGTIAEQYAEATGMTAADIFTAAVVVAARMRDDAKEPEDPVYRDVVHEVNE